MFSEKEGELQMENQDFGSFYEGKDILVTGGCGSIGTEIVRQLLHYFPFFNLLFSC